MAEKVGLASGNATATAASGTEAKSSMFGGSAKFSDQPTNNTSTLT